MTKIIKNNLPLIILVIIVVFICFTNYTPGTILSGWDTLHPEFNLGLALKREIFGVFRSYQGLGAVAAHSDMADLPRILLLAVFDIFLPQDFLRYSYIFLALIAGPIGVYLFLYKHVLKNKTSSFLGGLFYLLNLGTLQQFTVPFEMFVTQYATLPWLFLFATDFLFQNTRNTRIPRVSDDQKIGAIRKKPTSEFLNIRRSDYSGKLSFQSILKKPLLLFSITTILAAPMAYAATLWYIYFASLFLYLGVLTISSIIHLRGVTSSHLGGGRLVRRSFSEGGMDSSEVNPERFSLLKKALILIIVTLLLNSFWILPNIYYILNHASSVPHANINRLFSEQAFLYNKQFGNIKDIAILKSFLFDWTIYAGNNQFIQLLTPWIEHLERLLVGSIGYVFAVISLGGIIYSIVRKNKILIAFLPALFLTLFFLFNDNPPTSPLFSFLQEHLRFFKEAYRFPQDKVRGVYTFLFAIYFANGQLLITRLAHRSVNRITIRGRFRYNTSVQALIFTIALFYFMLPAFKGQLINPYMRIKIPDYYFEMFNWFDNQDENARIANLPIHSFWGWDYYKWGFQGAGFIWFGIKQPVLARDFDRWNPYNEQYYREMSYAIYSQNPEALRSVLDKYNIKYILLDKNIIAPPNPSKVLLHEETQELLEKEDYIQKVKEFGNTLIVYEVKSNIPNNHFILQNPFIIREESKAIYEDLAYKLYGDYIIIQDGVYYPFRSITDNQGKILPNTLKLTQEGVVIKLPKNSGSFTLPSYFDTQEFLPTDLLVEKNQNQLNITFYPRLPTPGDAAWYPPITLKAPIPESENIILSINRRDNFILNSFLSNTPLSLGTVFLSTKNDNAISTYSSMTSKEIFPDLSATNYYIEPCEPSADLALEPLFGTELVDSNSFYIFGKDISLCMTIPLSEILPDDLTSQETLLAPTFNYFSDLPLRFCIAKLINGACQNYKSNNLLQRFGERQTVLTFGIQNGDIKRLGLQFRLDASHSQRIEKAMYESLTLTLTYPHFSTSFSIPSMPPSPSASSNPSTLAIPFSSDQQLSAEITKFPRTTGLCPNQPSTNPPIIKKGVIKENNDKFIRYTSEQGTACDHFSYQNLSQNEAYLIAITSRNVKGLPLTICVANQVTKHCDIYASLSSSNNFTTDIFLLPEGIKNESGFDLNIRSLGIKKTPAVNDLKSIEIIPFPYKWLSQIKESTPRMVAPRSGDSSEVKSVLILPYSFEKGWKAYRIMNYELGIMNWTNNNFPFIFGKELESHVLINNWANGWTIDNSDIITHNSEFRIIFLPQYLEYAGFVLLAGTIIYLIKPRSDETASDTVKQFNN